MVNIVDVNIGFFNNTWPFYDFETVFTEQVIEAIK
jgi:hypothetical protein